MSSSKIMPVEILKSLFLEGNFESFLQSLNSNENSEPIWNSNEYKFLKFRSLLSCGYYITLKKELEDFISKEKKISDTDLIQLYFLKCDVFLNLNKNNDGISVVNELTRLLNDKQKEFDNKEILLFRTTTYRLLFSPFDLIFDQYLKKFKELTGKIINDYVELKALLPEFYLNLAIIFRERSDLINAKVYLDKLSDIILNNKYFNASIQFQYGLIDFSNQFYDKAIKQFEKSLQLYREISNINKSLESIIYLSSSYLRNGELSLSEDILLQSIYYFKPIYDDLFIIMRYEHLGDIYFFKGDLKSSYFDCYNKAEMRYERNDLTNNLNTLYIKIARLKASEGNFDNSMLYIHKVIENFHLNNDFEKEIMNKSYLGNALFEMGNFEEAFNLWNGLDDHFKNSENLRFIAFNKLNIGKYYLITDTPTAILHYKNTIGLFEKLNLIEGLIESYLGYSIALEEYGNKYQDEERTIFYKTKELITNLKGNYLQISEGIYRLCLLSIENLLGFTRMYIDLTLNLLEKIPSSPRIVQKIKFLKAIKLKSIIRLKEQAQSMELFEEIVSEELMDYQTTLLSYLNLLEFKVFELKFSDNTEILMEADEILENLINLTSNNKMSSWYSKTLALKSQINLIKLNFEESKKNIHEAIDIAKKRNLKHLLISLNNQYDEMLSKIGKLEMLNENSNSISNRLKITNFLIFEKSLPKLLDITEEQPFYFSIIDSQGLSIYSHNFFNSSSEGFDQLMSGFLIAINSVILNLFSSSGFLERIKHKEYTIMIFQLITNLYICYAFKGPSYHAQEKIDGILSEFSKDKIMNSIMESSKNKKTLNKLEIDLIESILKKYLPIKNLET